MGLVRFIGDRFSRFGRRCLRLPKSTEDARHRLGREGERLAARFLRQHGYKILYRNFRAPHGGEADLVCRDKGTDTLVFVEVKTRRGVGYGTPAEAVTVDKQQLIIRGALAWLRLLGRPGVPVRFDVVEILMTDDCPDIQLIKHAFAAPNLYVE